MYAMKCSTALGRSSLVKLLYSSRVRLDYLDDEISSHMGGVVVMLQYKEVGCTRDVVGMEA